MFSKWPIRNKLLLGTSLLLVIVATLSASGFVGMYSYRSLVKSLSNRATELPPATQLAQQVSDLRVTLGRLCALRDWPDDGPEAGVSELPELRQLFNEEFADAQSTLDDYIMRRDHNREVEFYIGDSQQEEAETVEEITQALHKISTVIDDESWSANSNRLTQVGDLLESLQTLSSDLPSFLHDKIQRLAVDVRTEYRTFIILTWISSIGAALLFTLYVKLFYDWVFRPLRLLVGVRAQVAAGNFDYRIRLQTHDEMSELADSMNDMTARFQDIRDDLDRQVRERTNQVVRSEQLASVGFLAAGVAHGINNPLASIAMCAESLEGRVEDLLREAPTSDFRLPTSGPQPPTSRAVIRQYLRMIQTEAFRCKEITEKLLDFSRLGEVRRQNTDLRELVQGVIEMVRHLGKYQHKHVELVHGNPVIAAVNPQEIKQVVLNLLTNALDSLDPDGAVRVELNVAGNSAEMIFTDNGCGLTDEVRQHLFEPFFTRRRAGQGTGLGLSIAYRIVADHGGQIDVHSEGPGRGSRFRVTLALRDESERKRQPQFQAA